MTQNEEPGKVAPMLEDPKASPFWKAAVRSGLLDTEALHSCFEAIAPEKRTPEAFDRRLARQTVASGKLTLWQAQQLLVGRWKGLRIGKYTLLDTLGRGGMGQVYLARDTRLDRHVAIKILSGHRRDSRRAVDRFAREAKIAGRLQDEHLIRVYDDGEAFGLLYLVMEYIDGRSVAQLIEAHGPLPPAVAAELGRQTALGLGYLHRNGLLHRDVTPSNILVDRRGVAKLTDLGLAVDLDDPSVLTVEGSTVGTFDYLSPEQARSSHNLDIRSDLYSLGCTIYHVISGSVPYPAPSLAEKLNAHLSSEPVPLEAVVPSCPPALIAVVRRMMNKSPSQRYSRPSEVIAALEPFASGPGPVSRLVSMRKGGEAEATEVLDETYYAKRLGAHIELDVDGFGSPAGAPADRFPQDVFRRIEIEEKFLTQTGSQEGRPPGGTGRRLAARPVAAVAFALVASILAIAVALFW